MILFALAGLCLLSVPLSGGSLRRLSELRLRCLWLAPLALLTQVVIVNIVPGGSERVHEDVHLATYAMLFAFLAANLRVSGAKVVLAGALLNFLAIASNGGVMPASARAERIAGLTLSRGEFHNSVPVAHPHLLWLGDVIPVPGPLPNVLSVGDCVIFLGLLVLLHRVCRTSRRAGIELIPVLPHLPA